MSTLDTKLTAEEEKAVIDKVYETLSNDIKEVVDALKDDKTENDEAAKQNITKLSTRLDQGFYNYCKEIFKDQEQITEIKKAINAALLKFPKNNDLIKLKSFVEGTKTYTDNTKTETFEGTGRNINRFNGTTEQQKELTENLNNLNSNINTLPETNLKTLLNAMLTVAQSPRGEGTQALQYYIYNELPEDQKEDFLVKNKKRGFTGTEIKPEAFDGIKGYNTLTAFINISNAKIDKYNKDKQDIDYNNDVFNQLMGNSDENTRIINEALAKAKADKAKKEAEEEQKRKIEAGLQKQTDFIEGIKGINDIPEEGKQKVSTKLQSLQARYDEEINRTNRNETLLRSLQDLLKNPVLIYQRILIGEKIKERINTLQTNLQEKKIKPEDLTRTGFEIKNNLVVISSAFEKALKAENLWDEEEITENKSQQRESRDTFETTLINDLQNLNYVKKCKTYFERRQYILSKAAKGGVKKEIKEQRLQQIDNAAEEDGTANKIQTLKNMGIHFDEKGNIRNIENGADRSKIQKFIDEQKTAQQDNFGDNNTTINTSQNLTPETYEDNEVAKVVEVTKDNFRSLCGKEKLPAKQIKKLVEYANNNNESILILKLTEIDEDGAKELAQHQGTLWLSGLTSIDKETATELANHQGALYLNGLTSIDKDIATELANHQGALYLTGLTSIDKDIATELAKHQGALYLTGPTSIDKDIATELAKHQGELSLNGLTSIDKDIATELAEHQGTLWLSGLTSIDKETATELANHQGALYLTGLTSIDKDIATELANHQGELSLSGLTSIDKDIATELAEHQGELWLRGLQSLDKKTASKLLQRNKLHLKKGLTNLLDADTKSLLEQEENKDKIDRSD